MVHAKTKDHVLVYCNDLSALRLPRYVFYHYIYIYIYIYIFQHTCRRVHCPASEYMVNCKCKQPFKGVYGMRILLTIKLIPRSGYLTTLKTKQIANFNNALEESLHTITENIFIDLIGLFECHADFGDYYLFFVVVRSHPGYDTKEVIEPFLDYMDNKRKVIEMVDNKQSTYEVRLTSRIRLWNTYNYTSYSLNFRDLESTVQNYSTIFSTDALLDAYYQEFQVLSPLLYCMQVQLNENEFEETDGQLTTLRTTRKTTISYYHRTSPSTVRVCEDQYINKNIGIRVSHSNFYLYVLLVFGCGAFHVF